VVSGSLAAAPSQWKWDQMQLQNWLANHLFHKHSQTVLKGGMHPANYSAWLAYHERIARPECKMDKSQITRPSDPDNFRPVYGGPTLLEFLWEEMDRLMEGLMSKTDSEDGGDKFRAEELGFIIAVVTNVYSPDLPGIRKEALRRYREGTS
jgi:hypothetical protein